MCAEILSNQTISKTPGECFSFDNVRVWVCLYVLTTQTIHHSHPLLPHAERSAKNQVTGSPGVPNGNRVTDMLLALWHNYEARLPKHNRVISLTKEKPKNGIHCFLHASIQSAKVAHADFANHWTSLRNLWREIAWGYVMRCLSQTTRVKNGPIRMPPSGHPVCFKTGKRSRKIKKERKKTDVGYKVHDA